MKAAVLENPGNVVARDYEDPVLLDGEILVRTQMSGVCFTDVLAFKGDASDYTLPVILGHEITGVIDEINCEIDGYNKGDKVCLYPITSCGICKYCIKGQDKFCSKIKGLGHDLNGGFAEYVKVPSSLIQNGGVVKIPSRISSEEAVLVEPLACCINCVDQSNISINDDVVIMGAGPTGLLLTQLCKSMGANVVVSEPVEERRIMAKKVGADEIIDPIQKDIVKQVKEIMPHGANKVIAATGNPMAISQAPNLMEKGGTLSIFGLSSTNLEINLDHLHFYGYDVRAPWGLSLKDFHKAVELVIMQKLTLKPLITKKYPLERTLEAIEATENQIGLKNVIIP
jgi:L-iditol 2-dehydrogenase